MNNEHWIILIKADWGAACFRNDTKFHIQFYDHKIELYVEYDGNRILVETTNMTSLGLPGIRDIFIRNMNVLFNNALKMTKDELTVSLNDVAKGLLKDPSYDLKID